MVRHNDQPDNIKWKLSSSGEYSSKSACEAQFLGTIATPALSSIWKTWALPKCKFFAWLILQNRVWSSDRLARRGWPHNTSCALCRQKMETALHLLADCRFTRRVWESNALWIQEPLLKPSNWKIANSALYRESRRKEFAALCYSSCGSSGTNVTQESSTGESPASARYSERLRRRWPLG